MTRQLSYYLLHSVSDALRQTNETLGVRPGAPNGAVDPDATEQEMQNHAALVGLTRAVEYLENWAVELSVHLEAAGVVELVREEP